MACYGCTTKKMYYEPVLLFLMFLENHHKKKEFDLDNCVVNLLKIIKKQNKIENIKNKIVEPRRLLSWVQIAWSQVKISRVSWSSLMFPCSLQRSAAVLFDLPARTVCVLFFQRVLFLVLIFTSLVVCILPSTVHFRVLKHVCRHQCAWLTLMCLFLCLFVFFICCCFVFFAPEPKPVYAQPGQPDVDLPVSPSDAPVPSVAHDDSILR